MYWIKKQINKIWVDRLSLGLIITVTSAPILALYQANINEIELPRLFTPLLIINGFFIFLFYILNFLINKKYNTALLVFTLSLISLHYRLILGNIGNPNFKLLGTHFGEDKIMFIGSIFIFLVAFVIFFKIKTVSKLIPKIVIIVFGMTILLNTFKIIHYEINQRHPSLSDDNRIKQLLTPRESSMLPDIYYIIPDRYAGEDSLNNYFNFDNYDFNEQLSKQGFYPIKNAYANYPTTGTSLASSLNMEYVETLLGADIPPDQTLYYPLIAKNTVAENLKQIGYTFIQYGSWWEGTRFNTYANINLDSPIKLDQFSQVLFSQTIAEPIAKAINVITGNESNIDQEHLHQSLANKQYQSLQNISKSNGPKFVFVHLLQPHYPYVFNRDCNSIIGNNSLSDNSEEILYLGQLECTNTNLITSIKSLIHSSKNKPIIIVQADEGPLIGVDMNRDFDVQYIREKSNILFQILEPDNTNKYPFQTPVNIFRYIFNKYFGTSFEYLPERMFAWKYPVYNLKDITDEVKNMGILGY